MKKLSVGMLITCIAALLAIAAFIVYSVNVGAEGYYNGAYVNNFALMVWGAVVCLLAAIALKYSSQSKVAEIVSGILRIAAPALLAWALMNLISARVDGLGYIYFSNADVAKEVQTPANMASATGAIASMVVLGLSVITAVVGAFFSMYKKNA